MHYSVEDWPDTETPVIGHTISGIFALGANCSTQARCYISREQAAFLIECGFSIHNEMTDLNFLLNYDRLEKSALNEGHMCYIEGDYFHIYVTSREWSSGVPVDVTSMKIPLAALDESVINTLKEKTDKEEVALILLGG